MAPFESSSARFCYPCVVGSPLGLKGALSKQDNAKNKARFAGNGQVLGKNRNAGLGFVLLALWGQW